MEPEKTVFQTRHQIALDNEQAPLNLKFEYLSARYRKRDETEKKRETDRVELEY